MPGLIEFLPLVPRDVRIAVEFRQRAWINEGVLALFAEHGAALALTDGRWIPRKTMLALAERPTADFAYLRWMGADRSIVDYSRIQKDRARELEAWATAMLALAAKVTSVHGYVNNHFAGHSPESARRSSACLASAPSSRTRSASRPTLFSAARPRPRPALASTRARRENSHRRMDLAHAPSVALVTCEEYPGLTPDDVPLAAALARRGLRPLAALWDDPAVRWEEHAAVVLRSCWDYHVRAREFERWLDRLEQVGARVHNPLPTLRWNMRKTYLRDMAAAGVPVAPTVWAPQGLAGTLRAIAEATGWTAMVVKPTVSSTGWERGWPSASATPRRNASPVSSASAR